MDQIPGNEKILSYFLNAVKIGKVAGCYLIEGADGTGKLSVARFASAALLCQSPKADGTPCQACHTCRSIMQGTYVDVLELSPEDGKQIQVSAVREMLQFTHVLPSQGDWRVFIIRQAECMNKRAQNALLKSIEEPRPQTVFFLLTRDQTHLLPTVRSRAVKLRTMPMSRQMIREALLSQGADPVFLEDAVLLSGGSLGKAKKILEDKEYHNAREKVLFYFKALMDGAGFTRLSLILPPGKMNRQELGVLLPMVKAGLRDLMCCRFAGETEPEFFTDTQFMRDLAGIISPKAATRLFELTLELEQAVAQNVNVFSALSGFHLTAQRLTREYG